MAIPLSRTILVAIALATTTVAGCTSFIKRDEFDSTIGELRASDARLESRLQTLEQQLQTLSQKYDAPVGRTEDGGGIRVDTAAYFDTDDATLDPQAKELLDDFARAISRSHGNAMITVEGFTDPSGTDEANQRLGQRRADAARDYLVNTAGMHPAQVQAVSYGAAENRQVRTGATGREGRDNRRIALVVDYAGPQLSMSME